MKVMRKIVSSLLVLAMMLTLLPTGVFATDTAEDSTNRAKLRMVYMGPVNNQNTDTPTIQNSFPDTSSWVGDPTTGTTFWVGLVLSDLKKMDDATATGHTDSSGNVTNSHFYRYTSMDDYNNQGTYMPSGIYSIASGIEYAGEYLEPLFSTQLAFQGGVMNALKRMDTRYTSYKLQGVPYPYPAEEINDGNGREASIIKEENDPDLLYGQVTSLDENQTTNIFFSQDLMNNDDLVIMAIPFRLKAKPPAGTKIIQAALNAANTVIMSGSSSYGISKLSWDTDRGNLSDQNAKAHIDYQGDWNMFPNYYTVNFLDGKDGDPVDEATVGTNSFTVAEDTAVEDNVLAGQTIPVGKNLDNAETGKYFAGWKYDKTVTTTDDGGNETTTIVPTAFYPETIYSDTEFDDDGNPKVETEATKLTPSELGISDTATELNVYADYITGPKITFTTDATIPGTSLTVNGFNSTDSDSDGKPDGNVNVYVNPNADADNYGVVDATKIPTTTWTASGWGITGWTDGTNTYAADLKYEETDDEGNKVKKDVIFTANTELKAVWSNQLKISFHDNNKGDGTTDDAHLHYANASTGILIAPLPTEPERTDYVFQGWNNEKNGTGDVTITAADLATYNFNGDAVKDLYVGGVLNLYAQWEVDEDVLDADKATLTFEAVLSGVDAAPASITVLKNTKIYAKDVPNWVEGKDYTFGGDAYTFLGWYQDAAIDNADKFDFATGHTLSESDIAYAHWNYNGPDKVTIKFKNKTAKDGAYQDYTSVSVKPGATLGTMLPSAPDISATVLYDTWNTKEDGTGVELADDTPINAATLGDAFVESPSTTDNTAEVIVYAQYNEELTVNFDANVPDGITTAADPASVKGYTNADYPGPAASEEAAMKYTTYKFMGWNTKSNGSGDYIKVATDFTYGDVAAAKGATIKDGAVTLYAQWMDVPDTVTDPPTGPSYPPAESGGVLVIFDSNAPDSDTSVKGANPGYKYPTLGDAIGATNMPENPTRDNYTCQTPAWNTQPDGSGTEVDGATVITDKIDGIVKNADGSYTLTVYAQWDVNDDVTDKVTLTFTENATTGDADDKTFTIAAGDALGFTPNGPTRDGYIFDKWTDGSGTAFNPEDKFAAGAAPIYYAQWKTQLYIEIVDDELPYTGSTVEPTYNVYVAVEDDTADSGWGKSDLLESGKTETELEAMGITFDYYGDKAPTTKLSAIKDVDLYEIDPTLAGGTKYTTDNATISYYDSAVTITKAQLTFIINPAAQEVEHDKDNAQELAIEEVQGILGTDSDVYEVWYQLWTDAKDSGTVGVIDNDDELGEAFLADTDKPVDAGKYVVTIKITSDNYELGTIKAPDSATEAVRTFDYAPDYVSTSDAVGKNLQFVIKANDPSLKSDLKIDSKDTDTTTNPTGALVENLGLWDSTYTTSGQTFAGTVTPNADGTYADQVYYVRVDDVNADEVILTFTPNEEETTKVGDPTVGELDGPDANGAYTITVPLKDENGDPVTSVSFITYAGNVGDTTVPNITYTFNIKQLITPRIDLNYGNTPAGMIWNNDDDYPTEAAKTTACEDFKDDRLFEGVSSGLYYYDAAWTSYTGMGVDGADYNGDDDKEAIVVFNRKAFRDVGFKGAYYASGEKVPDANVSITLEMTAFGSGDNADQGGVPMYDDATDQARTVTATGSGNNYLFTEFQNYDIRPDVYEITYSFKDYTLDPLNPVTVEKKRKVIAVSPRGDVEINAFSETSSADASEVTKNITNFMSTKISSLFKFRVADVDTNTFYEISSADASEITKQIATGIAQFYNELPNTALSTDTSTSTTN